MGSVPGLAQWVKDLVLLWLWRRSQTWLGSGVAVLVAAAAQIRPIAWEPPYATSAALKRKKKKSLTAVVWVAGEAGV